MVQQLLASVYDVCLYAHDCRRPRYLHGRRHDAVCAVHCDLSLLVPVQTSPPVHGASTVQIKWEGSQQVWGQQVRQYSPQEQQAEAIKLI